MGRIHKRLSSHVLVVCTAAACLWSQNCLAQFGNPRFSPDEEYLAFDYCQAKECRFVIYSLKSGVASAFESPKGEAWINPSFSPSSNSIVFVIIRGPSDSQLAMASVNGSGFRMLTTSQLLKHSPSFAPDGKSVVFVGGTKTVNERGTATRSDLYTVNASSREERRVTDLNILDIFSPFFLPNGEDIVFSTAGTAYPRSKLPAPEIPLDRLYRNRTIFVLPIKGPQELKPVIQTDLVVSSPMPLAGGAIAVLVRVNELDQIKWNFVYDVFLIDHGKSIRHTMFRSYVWGYGISRSGELVAYVTDIQGQRSPNRTRLMLWRKSTGNAVELSIPAAKIIPLRK